MKDESTLDCQPIFTLASFNHDLNVAKTFLSRELCKPIADHLVELFYISNQRAAEMVGFALTKVFNGIKDFDGKRIDEIECALYRQIHAHFDKEFESTKYNVEDFSSYQKIYRQCCKVVKNKELGKELTLEVFELLIKDGHRSECDILIEHRWYIYKLWNQHVKVILGLPSFISEDRLNWVNSY